MFKPYFGICKSCNEPRLLVAKNGLCKFHNEEKKNAGKPEKVPKPKVIKPKEVRKGQCRLCPENTIGILEVAHYCRFHNEQRKKAEKEERSKRIVKLVNKAENKKSHPELKKELWEVFSEYIRIRDSKDGMFTCISCGIPQSASGGNLQAGHYYKSETYPALRYNIWNVNGQCRRCNVFREGNRQEYELGLIKKYGQARIDILKISCHNKIRLGRFELELLIKEFTDKLKILKQS